MMVDKTQAVEAPTRIEYEATVAGKKITFRQRMPMREGKVLPKLLDDLKSDSNDWEKQVPVMTLLVEAWEFPGDPKDSKAYEELDTLGEFLPLVYAVGEHVKQRIEAVTNAKNLAGPSS